jgi:DNA mismatch repair protein MutL
MSIKVLSEIVASQIAAGEVIERPSSVVKELIENALDANASSIHIRIEKAGKNLIEVGDDGEGIPYNELALAISRHATSKLSTAEDLQHITTLGFRGEALASIASVSKMTLVSQQGKVEYGGKLVVEGGKLKLPVQTSSSRGTIIRVENLFYNVPARLKFLKQDVTERAQIYALVTKYSLAYPNIKFSYYEENKLVFQTAGNGETLEILSQIYGIEIAKQLIKTEFITDDISINGYISPLPLTRSNRREITFFVNGRWIQDISLSSAFVQAYHTLLMVGRYPLGFLAIKLPPEDVDVNVHPAKAEVRFRQNDRIFGCVQRAVKRALLASSPIPQITPTYWRPYNGTQTHAIDPSWWLKQPNLPTGSMSHPTEEAKQPIFSQSQNQSESEGEPKKLPMLRVIGQIGQVYLVAEGPDGLYLIDQHAAHERVLFEKFTKGKNSQKASQALLEPLTFQLSRQQAQLLNSQMVLLSEMGFDLDEFGVDTFRLRSIPGLFSKSDPLSIIRAAVEDIEEDETPLQSTIEDKIIARICKRAAIKGGQNLSIEEQRALITDLEKCESPRTCPHGRPTMIHLSVDLLERQFGRRGAR